MLYYAVHECAHLCFKKLAQEAGKSKWAHVILEAANQTGRYSSASDIYQQARGRQSNQFQFDYILEEMTDTEVFRVLDPDFVQTQQEKWVTAQTPFLTLSQPEYDHAMNQLYSWGATNQTALYLGLQQHRGQASRANSSMIKNLDEKNRGYLKNNSAALELYEATIQLGKFIQEYASSSSFRDSVLLHIPPEVLAQIDTSFVECPQ